MKPRFVHIVCSLFLCCLPLSGSAQNNPYKIRDELYPYYQRASRLYDTEEGLLIADTLWHEAVRMGDKKAQCLGLIIPVRHYMDKQNDLEFYDAIDKLKDVSRANGFLQYYYYACSNNVHYLLNKGRLFTALQRAEEMKDQAFRDNDAFGIYKCIDILSTIYNARGNTKEFVRYKEEALEYMLENLPDQDPTPLYLRLAEHYTVAEDFTYARTLIRKAEKSIKTEGMKARVLLEKCRLFFYENRKEDFYKAYGQCINNMEGFKDFPRDGLTILNIYKAILDKRYADAHQLADRLTMETDRYSFHTIVSKHEGDWEQAFYYRGRQYSLRDSVADQVRQADLSELSGVIGTEQLKREKVELQLRNARMQLEQIQSQTDLEHSQAENARLRLDNQELEISNLTTEKERQALDLEKGRLMLDKQRAASRFRIIVFSSIILFMGITLFWLVTTLRRKRKTTEVLKQKNEELIVARDEARNANEMKSVFIQNMSHEIRTPLNSIVGFSQIITDPDMELEPEERAEYSRLITHNSDLLTTLVNDVLNLAELESSRYTLNLAARSCNEICKTSLSTVEHRKPTGVELRFSSEVPDDYTILTDNKRVEQVLVNLLTNAEKFTTEGEIHLHCSLSENPGHVTFSVADTGCGIPADKAEVIFERFQKLDSFKQGTGLGLSICRTVAELMKGEVRVDTSYTKGARFVFILPLKKAKD